MGLFRSVRRNEVEPRRRDCGNSKLSDDEVYFLSGLIETSRRGNEKVEATIKRAVENAYANGRIREKVSVSTASRQMRRLGVHPEQLARPDPHTNMSSPHPNYLWQVDVSVCVVFYLPTGGVTVVDETVLNKNKPRNLERAAKERVLRYLVTDHCTGAFFLRYYNASGETWQVMFDFLMEAFRGRENPQEDPFRGVPHHILWDAGSANISHPIKTLLDGLGVKHQPHMPGNPRAKGQVERTHELVEREFEGFLHLKHVRDLEELNARAVYWMRGFNATEPHSRTKAPRYEMWMLIHHYAGALRECPGREICEHLLRTRWESRSVRGDLTIQYKVPGYESQCYSVRDVQPLPRNGETVQVCINPYSAPNVLVLGEDEDGNTRHYECEPIELDEFGFSVDAVPYGQYRAAPDTDTARGRKRINQEAYGGDTQQETRRARSRRKAAYGGQLEPLAHVKQPKGVHYFQRAGEEIDIPAAAQVELKPLRHMEAIKRLINELGRPLQPDENQAIKNRFPGGVPEDQIKELADDARAGRLSRTIDQPHHQSGGTSL